MEFAIEKHIPGRILPTFPPRPVNFISSTSFLLETIICMNVDFVVSLTDVTRSSYHLYASAPGSVIS